ncbi:Muskelin [Astathelohania contejeani]|uniref:Muskelin n=1 Tax=Astathelohania contejeani TaxID=164912 RepID=A0ABQ7HVP3_9MICR|nr:Muskelin [Thelohania contejeani]
MTALPLFTDKSKFVPINYEVTGWSTYSGNYRPQNIKEDNPLDPSSRWSSGSNDQKQFLELTLENPALITTITFGKFSKIHVCNVKEMKIYVKGNGEWIKVLHSGLHNDTDKETLNMNYICGETYLISKKVRIVPLAAWGMNFNYSIWHVELRGIIDPEKLRELESHNRSYCNYEAMRLCLKFLKGQGFETEQISKQSGISLEGSVIKQIYCCIKENAFERIEEIIKEDESIFDEYIENSAYIAQWRQVGKKDVWPPSRGGHQFIAYYPSNTLYLYGGWNGTEELGDLWIFDCERETWKKLSENTRLEGGPGKRSCHKMIAYDNFLYVFGRYIPTEYQKESAWVRGEIYKYDTNTNLWSKEEMNSREAGGPENVYDHQIVSVENKFYIMGGRGFTREDQFYNGLFRFSLVDQSWKVIRKDVGQPVDTPIIRGRVGHSLVYLNQKPYYNTLAIVGGQRGKEYFKDVLMYDLKTDTVYQSIPFPVMTEGRMTQRAVKNSKGELVIMLCYSQDRETVYNTLDIYTLSSGEWKKCTSSIGPIPRSAHQFIYNERNDRYYLFGGNCVKNSGEMRENDLWELTLSKPNRKDVINELIFLIRKYKFLRMLSDGVAMEDALDYLQTCVYDSLDHSNPKNVENFRSLCCEIYKPPCKYKDQEILDRISVYYPKNMRAPLRDLQSLM